MNDGLFFVICRNWRFSPSIMFVVYMIFRISMGYSKKVLSTSQFSSQLLTQEGYWLRHFFCKVFQLLYGLVFCHCRVDFLQIGNDLTDVFVANIFGRTANLVHDAALQPCLGIDRLNRLGHSTETIGTEQINIQNSSAFQVIQHI